MQWFNLFFWRGPHPLIRAAYAAAVGSFLWIIASFYIPGQGFTSLVMFGDRESNRYLPELQAIHYYVEKDSYGYDAQFYAQIAMRPRVDDPELHRAVDGISYRARRILFCWTAWALALGDPVRALYVFSVENIVCWLLLAGLLLRWFPATSWQNFFRWGGVMFSFGLCFSVRASLTDGPSLLLIAASMALLESNRPWSAAAVMGISGLGKETNILAGTAFEWPREHAVRAWLGLIGRGLAVIAPLGLWMGVLWFAVGDSDIAGLRNFDRPLAAYATKWAEAIVQLAAEGPESVARWSLLMLAALTAQFFFFILWPDRRNPWWRLGAAYAALMAFLGDAVWEGYPGAASRVLLPMTLAFNVLVPRRGAWWIVLLLGNLTVLCTPDTLKPPGRPAYRIEGPRELHRVARAGRVIEVEFGDKWYPDEQSYFQYWRWSRGDADLVIRNPHPFAVRADVRFQLRSLDEREIMVFAGDQPAWRGPVHDKPVVINLPDVVLPPGGSHWRFTSDRPPVIPRNGDLRRLAFSLRDLKLVLKTRVDKP